MGTTATPLQLVLNQYLFYGMMSEYICFFPSLKSAAGHWHLNLLCSLDRDVFQHSLLSRGARWPEWPYHGVLVVIGPQRRSPELPPEQAALCLGLAV